MVLQVEDIVVEPLARKREGGNRELGESERQHSPSIREPVGENASHEIAAAKACHEGGDDDRDREDVDAREEGEHALPDHLV